MTTTNTTTATPCTSPDDGVDLLAAKEAEAIRQADELLDGGDLAGAIEALREAGGSRLSLRVANRLANLQKRLEETVNEIASAGALATFERELEPKPGETRRWSLVFGPYRWIKATKRLGEGRAYHGNVTATIGGPFPLEPAPASLASVGETLA